MAESTVVSALAKKHARLLGELSYHRKMVKQIEQGIEATGQSIKLFDPEYNLSHIKAIRRHHRSEHFKQGECSVLVLDVLRESDVPLDTKAVVAEIVKLKRFELDDAELNAVQCRVVNVLKGHCTRNNVKRVQLSGNVTGWAIV